MEKFIVKIETDGFMYVSSSTSGISFDDAVNLANSYNSKLIDIKNGGNK